MYGNSLVTSRCPKNLFLIDVLSYKHKCLNMYIQIYL